jgi:rubrerythrin
MITKLEIEKLNLMDALDIAILIEEEAEERYAEFSEIVGTGKENDAGELFRTMKKNEAKHGAVLLKRRQSLFGTTPKRVTREMIWDIEAPDYGQPRTYMSAYQAMEVALRSEIKAHDFFEAAVQVVADAKVKKLFLELRDEEIEHRNILEKWMSNHQGEKGAEIDNDDADEPSAL